MAERLRHEITQLLAEPDDSRDPQGRVNDLARARLAAGIAEGLDESELRTRARGAAGTDDRMRLGALLDDGLPPAERDAMLAALARDPAGRAELSSAAALVDAVDSVSHSVPPGLLARAIETFGGEPLRAPPRDRPSARPRWPSSRWMLSLAAILLVAVVTPAVLLLTGDRNNGSDQGSEPIERGLSYPGAGKKAVPEQKPGAPATSCDDKSGAARTDQPLGKADREQPRPAVQPPGEARKPEPAELAPAPTDDPCRPKPALDGRSTAPAAPPLPGTRN